MSIDFTPHALFDIDNATERAERERAGRAARLQTDIDRVLARLERLPESAELLDPPSVRYPDVRVAQLTLFRYAIYYRPTADGILVVRMLHTAQDSNSILYSDPTPPSA